MTAPPLPRDVNRAFGALPAPIGKRLLQVRALIFATAAAHDKVGRLTETLTAINYLRRSNGLSELRLNAALSLAATSFLDPLSRGELDALTASLRG